MPKRIQLKRTKGWRKPEGAIVVARPSKWGNPFTVAGAQEILFNYQAPDDLVRAYVVTAYRDWINEGEASEFWFLNGAEQYAWIQGHIKELRGHDLCCWCSPGQPCHADVLLELSNKGVANR